MVAAAEGGRRRRRGCWCLSWWVAGTASARTRGEGALQRPAGGAGASSGSASLAGEGRAVRPRCAYSPPATSGRARAPQASALPHLPALSSRRSQSQVSPPPITWAAALTATRTRVPWRTRTLGILSRLEPLSYLRGLLPWEGGLVAPWVEKGVGAPPPGPLPLFPPLTSWSDVLSRKVLGGFPYGHPSSPSTPDSKSSPGLPILWLAP